MLKLKEKLMDIVDSIYWNHFESLDFKGKIIRLSISVVILIAILKFIF